MQHTFANGMDYYYAMFGQLGLSVHLTDDNEEIVYGAPGIANWKGSVIVNRRVEENLPNLNKRSIDSRPINRIRRQSRFRKADFSSNPISWNSEDDTYFGYSVTSANFEGPTSKTLYVASAPRANDLSGEVYIFDYDGGFSEMEQKFKKLYTFVGHEMGESFGYSLLTDDFNGDGLIDIAVGAPTHKSTQYNDGRVYVFLNRGGLNFEEQKIPLEGTYNYDELNHAQFGLALGKIGDINNDGYSGELFYLVFIIIINGKSKIENASFC